jgi:ParD-like antitoxin of type II ParDE toxin-antitoxin system
MGQPVKLSDKIVLDARVAAELSERSIASQIEYWARIGRATDMMLRADDALRLKQRGEARPLSEILESVDTPDGRARTRSYLATRRYPHFEAAPDRPGHVIKIDEDGTRTLGRFVNRQFRRVK